MSKPLRGKAMSPSPSALNFDPTNPIQVATRMVQLEGTIVRTQEAFAQTAQELKTGVEGLRHDLRSLTEKLGELPRLNNEQAALGQALGRAFTAIENLASTTESQFRARDESLEEWKEKHTADNQRTRDGMILWNGVAIGFSALASCLVGVILYIYTGDKAAARERAAKLESTHVADVNRLDTRVEGNAATLREIERYLTQEGTISGRPYVPTPRR